MIYRILTNSTNIRNTTSVSSDDQDGTTGTPFAICSWQLATCFDSGALNRVYILEIHHTLCALVSAKPCRPDGLSSAMPFSQRLLQTVTSSGAINDQLESLAPAKRLPWLAAMPCIRHKYSMPFIPDVTVMETIFGLMNFRFSGF